MLNLIRIIIQTVFIYQRVFIQDKKKLLSKLIIKILSLILLPIFNSKVLLITKFFLDLLTCLFDIKKKWNQKGLVYFDLQLIFLLPLL